MNTPNDHEYAVVRWNESGIYKKSDNEDKKIFDLSDKMNEWKKKRKKKREDRSRLNLPTQDFPNKLSVSIGQPVGGTDVMHQESHMSYKVKNLMKEIKETLGLPIGGAGNPITAFTGSPSYLPKEYDQNFPQRRKSMSKARQIIKILIEAQGGFSPKEKELVDQGYYHIKDHHIFGYAPLFKNEKTGEYKFVYQGKIMTPTEMYKDLVDNWRPVTRDEQDYRVSRMKAEFKAIGAEV